MGGRPARPNLYDGELAFIEGGNVSRRRDISIFLAPINEISPLRFGLSPLMLSWGISIPLLIASVTSL